MGGSLGYNAIKELFAFKTNSTEKDGTSMVDADVGKQVGETIYEDCGVQSGEVTIAPLLMIDRISWHIEEVEDEFKS